MVTLGFLSIRSSVEGHLDSLDFTSSSWCCFGPHLVVLWGGGGGDGGVAVGPFRGGNSSLAWVMLRGPRGTLPSGPLKSGNLKFLGATGAAEECASRACAGAVEEVKKVVA